MISEESGLRGEKPPKSPSFYKLPVKSTTIKRHDIQGLRAFAIISVFVYHLNARILPFGYLGVDMFFVISGFLMAMILSGKGKITMPITVDFYYRRLRRIMPTYLLVVLMTLTAAVVLVNPMDRQELVDEARPAIRLYSNIQPLFQKITYFELLNNYAFFAHTWSLCVELQFYLVVPFIFAVFHFTSAPVRCKLCIGIGIVAYFAQLLAPPLLQHGFTPLRMWQFLSGILVFYLTERPISFSSLLADIKIPTSNFETNGSTEFPPLPPATSAVFLTAPICIGMSTVVMIMNESIFCLGLARLLCTAFASLVIYAGASRQSWLLTNRVALWIGDHSYTIYLCHWPIIVYCRYLFGNRIEIYGAFVIVFLTLLLTALFDQLMDFVMLRLKSRTASLVFILALYLSCEPLLGFLSGTAQSKKNLKISDEIDTRRLIHDYYDGIVRNLTDEEALRYNGFLYGYAKEFKGCNHRIGLNASHFNTTRREIFTCREEGLGDQNALLIGNSLARHAFVGIAHHFRDLYRTFQLHSIENCSPFRLKRETESDCRKYVESLEAAFREFQPDVIFIIYRFPEDQSPFMYENDEILKAMRGLYSMANSFASKLVFIPTVEIRFRLFQPMDTILDVLRTRKSLKQLRMSRQRYYYHNNRPSHWLRVKNATCDKCVLVDWSDAVSHGDWLTSTDVRAKLTYFIDRLHVSDIGSFHFGKLMRTLYNSTLQS